MNLVALAAAGRYRSALRTVMGETMVLDGTLRTHASAAEAPDHGLRTELAREAGLIAADAGWWRTWEAAHAELKAKLEGAPCLPDSAMLAAVVPGRLPADL